MLKKQNIVVLNVLLLLLLADCLFAGIVGFTACFEFCATVSPGKFAGLLGIVFDIAGCAAMCRVVVARAIPIPDLCFADSTTFLNASLHEVNATAIKQGDLIYTLSSVDGQKIQTMVKIALEVQGVFDFVTIDLIDTVTGAETTLTVTTEHGVIIVEGDQSRAVKATEVVAGNQMFGNEGRRWKIRQFKPIKLPQKYVILTEAKTALVSGGILTTTACLH